MIHTYTSGVYRGQQILGFDKAYGDMKYLNNDEYDGQWGKGIFRNGEGVFKEAATQRIERRLYLNDQFLEVLEVIQEGHQSS